MKRIVVGIDEVGRGPLAGPLMLGGVFGISDDKLEGIRDSKKLSEKKREEWNEKIRELGETFVIGVSSADIDKHGIRPALNAAVADLLAHFCKVHEECSPQTLEVFLDGSLYAPAVYTQQTIIRGDEKHPIIAAASIVAKVRRDHEMVKYDKEYPEYGFACHKGYGTKMHIEAIKEYGFTPIHRKSFCKKIVRAQ